MPLIVKYAMYSETTIYVVFIPDGLHMKPFFSRISVKALDLLAVKEKVALTYDTGIAIFILIENKDYRS